MAEYSFEVSVPESGRIKYENPLSSRYSSKEMNFIFSPQNKFSTWRRMWLALAECEKQVGVKITDEQLTEMRAHLDDINFELAEQKEKELRHDVMSHIHAWGEQVPNARPIIHLGATSCFVGDNTDLLQMKQGLTLVKKNMLKLFKLLSQFAMEYKDVPTLGFTHYQPAQLTTVGKRATLWMQDLVLDFNMLEYWLEHLPFRGVKGTTGTQASFLELLEGDHDKVRELDRLVCKKFGFKRSIPVSGQTYTRKVDFMIVSVLSGIAQSLHKFAVDMRLLMNLKEVEEPFEKSQIGSSAMAYKRNPMRCERICSLARYVMSLTENTAQTHANQWFERTLDDSANRRIVLSEAFLATDVILNVACNVADGMKVWPLVIRKHVDAELPFMATENILMACVKAGGDRQELHESIRVHSMEAGRRVKEEGADNDLMSRIRADPAFAPVHKDLDSIMDPKLFVGRAPEQVVDFVTEEITPLLEAGKDLLNTTKVELNV